MKGTSWILLTGGALMLAGCHHDSAPQPDRADAFANEPAIHPTQQIEFAQAATGARADATLRQAHFDGGKLNSLGRQKLALMAQDEDAAGPVVVYLDLPATAPVPQARQAVVDYLKSQGLAETQIRVQDGPNPAAMSPAARPIEALHRLSDEKKDQPSDSATGYQPTAPSNGNMVKDMTNH